MTETAFFYLTTNRAGLLGRGAGILICRKIREKIRKNWDEKLQKQSVADSCPYAADLWKSLQEMGAARKISRIKPGKMVTELRYFSPKWLQSK